MYSQNMTAVGNNLDNVIMVASRFPGNFVGATTLDGGAGADTLIGGTGGDTYVIDNIDDVIIETSTSFGDTVQTTLNEYVLGTDIENLTFTGDGSFHGTGNELSNRITGGDGNDTLDGGSTGFDQLIGGKEATPITSVYGEDRYTRS